MAADAFYPRNATSFGVMTWVFAPDGRVVEKYWYGTGNDIISLAVPEQVDKRKRIHERQTEAMHYALRSSVEKWQSLQSGEGTSILARMVAEAREGRTFYGTELERLNDWILFEDPRSALLDQAVTVEGQVQLAELLDAMEQSGLTIATEFTDAADSRVEDAKRMVSALPSFSWKRELRLLANSGVHWFLRDDTIVLTDDPGRGLDWYAELAAREAEAEGDGSPR